MGVLNLAIFWQLFFGINLALAVAFLWHASGKAHRD